MGELAGEHQQAAPAQLRQRFTRGVRRDERMAVAVAADPGPEPETRQGAPVAEQLWIETGVDPGLSKTPVQFRQGAGENLREVEHQVAPFGGDLGLAQEDFAGAPEPFERDLDFLAAIGQFRGRLARVLPVLQQVEKAAVLFERGRAFRLGRMRGEHRFDHDPPQPGGDLRGGESGVLQTDEIRPPETGFRRGASDGFALAAHVGRHVFLDEIKQLKGRRVHLAQARREHRLAVRGVGVRGRIILAANPRHETGQGFFAQADEHFAQAFHQENQILIDLPKTGLQQIGGWYAHFPAN